MRDATVTGFGTLARVTLHSDAARDWVAENVEVPGYMATRDGFHAEPRHADLILSGMLNAGLDATWEV